MTCRRLRCPACGLLGRKARRRAADADAFAHIAWAAALARESRRSRLRRTFSTPVPAMVWHDHKPGQDCTDRCLTTPASTQVTTMLPPVPPEELARADAAVRRLFQ